MRSLIKLNYLLRLSHFEKENITPNALGHDILFLQDELVQKTRVIKFKKIFNCLKFMKKSQPNTLGHDFLKSQTLNISFIFFKKIFVSRNQYVTSNALGYNILNSQQQAFSFYF